MSFALVKRITSITAGWTAYTVWNWLYDNPFWLAVIAWMGVFEGSVFLTLGALVINYTFLVFYEKKELDWLGVDEFRKMKDYLANGGERKKSRFFLFNWLRSLFVWAVAKNNVLAFIALSIHADSFVTTAILRGRVGGTLTKKDYATFLGSTAFGCAYWSLRNSLVLWIIKRALLVF